MSINSKLDAMADRLITKVTKDFTTEKKRTKRGRGLSNTALRRLYSRKAHEITIKDACYLVMAEAYQVASGNGKFAANARQIMYQARPRVLRIIDKFCKNDSDFTQKHLPNFMAENPSLTASWDVTFDARGAITEPHTNERIGLGTVEVREYADKWHANLPSQTLDQLELGINTSGPDNRFEYMLLIEKEGFDDQLAQAQIPQRYDIAIASTKGVSTTASRQLVEHLSRRGITTLVAHDCDKYGFTICHTLQTTTRRFRYRNRPLVKCLGLRLADAQAMGLDPEPVSYGNRFCYKRTLEQAGATPQEIEFMRGDGWDGHRIELNAMPSDVFIDWLEKKLIEAGVKKVVPDDKILEAAYKRAVLVSRANKALTAVQKEWDTNGNSSVPVPPDLKRRIEESITDSSQPWEAAISELANEEGATDLTNKK